ncbi:putative lipase atg15 [Clydaea vesicula]|uniref:triacylglycerol lipase n=1 Tax=Clydaea vesicula TaxID=447962 RepID=A0AAD5U194_9FUNG|nr:putative lipase atg15 [Clydaea vesicula]
MKQTFLLSFLYSFSICFNSNLKVKHLLAFSKFDVIDEPILVKKTLDDFEVSSTSDRNLYEVKAVKKTVVNPFKNLNLNYYSKNTFKLENTVNDDFFTANDADDDYFFKTTGVDAHKSIYAPDMTDNSTVYSLALMSSDSYRDFEWIEVGGKWNVSGGFGWQENAIQGYVFEDPDTNLVVVAFKGTSLTGRTAPLDKYNDNMMFSCCCARVDVTWRSLCGCADKKSEFTFVDYLFNKKKHQCDWECLRESSDFDNSYFKLSERIFKQVEKMYPNSHFWFTGHSLGGAISSLVAASNFYPAVTFEAPAVRMFAERVGLIPSKHFPMYPVSKRVWKQMLDDYMAMLPIYHVGNTGDPIYTGSTFEDDNPNTLDHVQRRTIRHHQINYLIEHHLQKTNVPECKVQENLECEEECASWQFK